MPVLQPGQVTRPPQSRGITASAFAKVNQRLRDLGYTTQWLRDQLGTGPANRDKEEIVTKLNEIMRSVDAADVRKVRRGNV